MCTDFHKDTYSIFAGRDTGCIEQYKYYNTKDAYKIVPKIGSISSPESCKQKCQETVGCEFWSYYMPDNNCFLLKEGIDYESYNTADYYRGPKDCQADSPQGKISSHTNTQMTF